MTLACDLQSCTLIVGQLASKCTQADGHDQEPMHREVGPGSIQFQWWGGGRERRERGERERMDRTSGKGGGNVHRHQERWL